MSKKYLQNEKNMVIYIHVVENNETPQKISEKC